MTRLQATSCADFGSEVMKKKHTLGSFYAITTKQNINIPMFGLVTKTNMHIKNPSCLIQSPPRLYRFNIKFGDLKVSNYGQRNDLTPHYELFWIH